MDVSETKPGRNLLRRFLKELLGWRLLLAFILIVVFYSGENWSGKRAWEKCKRELEARGEVLDWAAYVPASVPVEQNIFNAPRMQGWFVRGGAGFPSGYFGARTGL